MPDFKDLRKIIDPAVFAYRAGTGLTLQQRVRDALNSVQNVGSTLSPLRFFARPDSGVTPAAGVTVTEAHQTMLGHGKEYTLSMFGWTGGSADIRASMQAALDAIEADGSGQLKLPSGILHLSGPLTWLQTAGSSTAAKKAIIGNGTLIHPDTGDFTALTVGSVTGIEPYNYFTTLRGFQIFHLANNGTGCALHLRNLVFYHLADLVLRGYAGTNGLGILVDGGVSQQGCMLNVDCHGNYVGMDFGAGSAALHMYNAQFNQNTHTGLILRSGIVSIHGGTFQNGSGANTYDIQLIPTSGNGMSVKVNDCYAESSCESFIKAGGFGGYAGQLTIETLFQNSLYTTVVDATEWDVRLSRFMAGSNDVWLKARNCTSVFLDKMPLTAVQPSKYDLDAFSSARLTEVAGGTVHTQTLQAANLSLSVAGNLAAFAPGAEPAAQTVGAIIRNSFTGQLRLLTDATAGIWRDVAFAPFDIASDLGPWLTEYFDADDATNSAGNVDGLVGGFAGLSLLPSATKPLYVTESALANANCVKCVRASNSYMDTGVLSPFIIAGSLPYVATVYLHPHSAGSNQTTLFELQETTTGKRFGQLLQEAGAGADTIEAYIVDANGFQGAGSPSATGNGVGHLFEEYLDGGQFNASQDGVLGGSVGGKLTIGGCNRLMWSHATNAALQGDVSIALQVICRVKPPDAVLIRFRAYVAARFGLTIA